MTEENKKGVTPHESYLLSLEVQAAEGLYSENPGHTAAVLVQQARRDRDSAVSILRSQFQLI